MSSKMFLGTLLLLSSIQVSADGGSDRCIPTDPNIRAQVNMFFENERLIKLEYVDAEKRITYPRPKGDLYHSGINDQGKPIPPMFLRASGSHHNSRGVLENAATLVLLKKSSSAVTTKGTYNYYLDGEIRSFDVVCRHSSDE